MCVLIFGTRSRILNNTSVDGDYRSVHICIAFHTGGTAPDIVSLASEAISNDSMVDWDIVTGRSRGIMVEWTAG